jgi:hypothetical protein
VGRVISNKGFKGKPLAIPKRRQIPHPVHKKWFRTAGKRSLTKNCVEAPTSDWALLPSGAGKNETPADFVGGGSGFKGVSPR